MKTVVGHKHTYFSPFFYSSTWPSFAPLCVGYLEVLFNLFTGFLKCLHLLQLFPSDVFHPCCYLAQSPPAVSDGCSRKRRMSQARCPHRFPVTSFSPFSPSSYRSFQHIPSPTWPTAAGNVCQHVQKNKNGLCEACKCFTSPTTEPILFQEAKRIISLSLPG